MPRKLSRMEINRRKAARKNLLINFAVGIPCGILAIGMFGCMVVAMNAKFFIGG